jgi:SAM-dependent methyltransferase
MDAVYAKYTPLIISGGHILDLGCGSGRDSKHFIQNGYNVTSLEPSIELAALASDYIDQSVIVKTAQQIDEINTYDGIWACASLLHVSENELVDVFQRLADSLRPNGAIYCSFKYGEGVVERNGRTFTDMNQEQFDVLLEQVTSLQILSIWQSADLREGRENEKWFNALMKKV